MSTASCATIIGWSLKRKICTELDIRWQPSKGAHLCLLIGDNATGKSLFRRIVSTWCSKDYNFDTRSGSKTEMIGLSMQDRAGNMMGVAHGFVYGDEQSYATGVNTGHTVTTAIATAEKRTNANVVFWDEPDTGLSDAYAADVGRRIAAFSMKPPAHTRAAFVVTHRKALVEQLLKAKPHVLFFGKNAPKTVEEYLTRPIEPADLEELYTRGHALFLKVLKHLRRD